MLEYNIYFSHNGNNEYKKILKRMNKHLNNFTILNGLGYYNGSSELSKCLRVVDLENDKELILKLLNICDYIKRIAKQECVLFTKREIYAELI